MCENAAVSSPNLKLLTAFYIRFLPDRSNITHPMALIIRLIDRTAQELSIGGLIVSTLRGEGKIWMDS